MNQLAAVSSPCYACPGMQKESYPDCSESCNTLNAYLIRIGDAPHKPTKIDPKFFGVHKYQIGDCCTPEEFLIVSKIIFYANKKLKITSLEIANQTGVSVYVIRCILRSAQKTMSIDNQNRILEWNERESILSLSPKPAKIIPKHSMQRITIVQHGKNVIRTYELCKTNCRHPLYGAVCGNKFMAGEQKWSYKSIHICLDCGATNNTGEKPC